MFERLGAEVEDAIDELRDVARGVYPQVLLPMASARRSGGRAGARPMPVAIGTRARPPLRGGRDDGLLLLPRVPAERGQARRRRRLRHDPPRRGRRPRELRVEDDGVGFDPGAVERGAGLTNLADRVAAVGGTLRIESAPGRGTRVDGRIPVSRKS